MRIRGRIGLSGLCFVNAIIICPEMNIDDPIRFCIDTGSSATTICYSDVSRLHIDYAKLTKSRLNALGIGGTVQVYLMGQSSLKFTTDDNRIHTHELERIRVLKHTSDRKWYDPKRVLELIHLRWIPSLLGMDVLRHYRIAFEDRTVVLEK